MQTINAILVLAVSCIASFSVFAQGETTKNFHYDSDIDFQNSLFTDSLLPKKLNKTNDSKISFDRVMIFGVDKNQWEQGGKLHIINDHTAGRSQTIVCSLPPDEGDKFVGKEARRFVQISGTIKDYSSHSGLNIDPCYVREISKD